MSGIFGALQIGLRSLSNAQAGLSVVNENIANVNTPGYSRKRIQYSHGLYEITSYGLVGSGAEISRIEGVRDLFLEHRIGLEYQSKGYFEGQQFGVKQLESIFAPAAGQGISDQLSAFFDSFLELASEPSSATLREVTIAEAEELARRLRATVGRLDSLERANRTSIVDSVGTVNGILDRIGEINAKLLPILRRGDDGGPLYDERQLLLNQLSEQMSIQVQSDNTYNMTISTTSGRLLVMGTEVTHLSVNQTTAGAFVTYEGADISSEVTSGKLGGLMDFQGSILASARSELNDFARELADQVNAAHRNGVDLDGNAGGDFFSAVAGDEARTLAVAISNHRLIAAAEPGGGIGDGTNAQALANLRDVRLSTLGDQSLHEFYSQTVFEVGLAVRSVEANVDLQDKVLRQLESQREGVSGVSLDEEAVNLLQYQRAYQASAKIIRVLDSLLQETLNLVS